MEENSIFCAKAFFWGEKCVFEDGMWCNLLSIYIDFNDRTELVLPGWIGINNLIDKWSSQEKRHANNEASTRYKPVFLKFLLGASDTRNCLIVAQLRGLFDLNLTHSSFRIYNCWRFHFSIIAYSEQELEHNCPAFLLGTSNSMLPVRSTVGILTKRC